MKIKSLLVAGLAVLALNAVAQENQTGNSKLSLDIEAIKALPVGETSDFLFVNAQFDEGMATFGGWKMVQFDFVLPEGLEGMICSAHPDTKVYNDLEGEEVQVLSWSAGMIDNNAYRCIAANLTATPITKLNLNVCRIKLKKNAELKVGDVIKVEEFKNIDVADQTWVNNPYTIDLGIVSAVENINAGKAVAGVKYYNVAGVASDEAFDGVNIVVTTYADGTQNVVKVVK